MRMWPARAPANVPAKASTELEHRTLITPLTWYEDVRLQYKPNMQTTTIDQCLVRCHVWYCGWVRCSQILVAGPRDYLSKAACIVEKGVPDWWDWGWGGASLEVAEASLISDFIFRFRLSWFIWWVAWLVGSGVFLLIRPHIPSRIVTGFASWQTVRIRVFRRNMCALGVTMHRHTNTDVHKF